jgi:hypothetical protein
LRRAAWLAVALAGGAGCATSDEASLPDDGDLGRVERSDEDVDETCPDCSPPGRPSLDPLD